MLRHAQVSTPASAQRSSPEQVHSGEPRSGYAQVEPEKGLAALEKAVELREAQIEAVGERGERAMIATAVMEHATAMVNLASALYVCKKMDDAKVQKQSPLDFF
eukprot:364443-Chlamydomonas_euryale.AAC.10